MDVSARLASDGGWDQISVSQLHALPKPASDTPESPGGCSVSLLSVLCWQDPFSPHSSDFPHINQTLLFLSVCLRRTTKSPQIVFMWGPQKSPCLLKAVHLLEENQYIIMYSVSHSSEPSRSGINKRGNRVVKAGPAGVFWPKGRSWG